MQAIELIRLHRTVWTTPGDVLLGRGLPDDELVVWRAARVLPGPAHQRSIRRQQTFPSSHRLLAENRVGQVPVNRCVLEAFCVECATGVNGGRHELLLREA